MNKEQLETKKKEAFEKFNKEFITDKYFDLINQTVEWEFYMCFDAAVEVMKPNGNTSDGYHTFNELYEHRFVLTKALFNSVKSQCMKSKFHYDGTMFDNYFIVGLNTPWGIASYHYHIDKWNDFYCDEVDRFPEWDGHTSEDAIKRIDMFFEGKYE